MYEREKKIVGRKCRGFKYPLVPMDKFTYLCIHTHVIHGDEVMRSMNAGGECFHRCECGEVTSRFN